MDAWNKFVSQLTDVFKSMSPGARVTSGLLFAAIILGAAFLFRMPTGSADDYLLAGRSFSPSELMAAQAAFAEAGLSDYEVDSTKIRVPRSKRAEYVAAMAENNAIPPDFFSHYQKALSSDNPFASQKVMDEKIRTAKQQTLSQFIRDFRGVEEAAVVYSEADKPGFRREKEKTASVYVKTIGGGLDENQVKAIRSLVAFAYAGLDRQKITIADSTGRTYGPEGGVDGEMGSNAYATHKAKFEEDWKRKIEARLTHIPGVIVGVNVELNPETRNQTSTVKYNDKPVTVRASEATSESTSTAPDVGGAAGARANNVGDGFRGNQAAQISSTASGAQSQQSTSKNETVNALGHEQRVSQQAALVPKYVSASIGIPRSYILKMWKEMQAPPAAGETATTTPDADAIKRLETETTTLVQNAVTRLLPERPAGIDKYDPINVTFYYDVPVDPQPIPTFVTKATQWAGDYWQSVAAVVLALVAMVMIRSMVGSITPTPVAPIATKSNSADAKKEEAKADQAQVETVLKQRRRLNASGPNLKEELRDLVREDPDAAANVLKVWIGDAA